MKIGLTGGIGCGKSAVLSLFADHGYLTCNADTICHSFYEDNTFCEQLVAHFGCGICAGNSRIDRRKLGRIVFGDAEAMAFLQSLIEPRFYEGLLNFLNTADAGGHDVSVEIPLLFEGHYEKLFDVTVAVWSPQVIRTRRMQERGWSNAEIFEREKAQLDPDKKLELADYGLINTGTLKDLEAQCAILFRP